MRIVLRRVPFSMLVMAALAIVWISGDWLRGFDQARAGLFDDLFGGGKEIVVPLPPVPVEYAAKRMPEGFWTDPKIIEEGRQIFMGVTGTGAGADVAAGVTRCGVACAGCAQLATSIKTLPIKAHFMTSGIISIHLLV